MARTVSYLDKHALFPRLIAQAPPPCLQCVVVIPCYDEPAPEKTLQSLCQCAPTRCDVEVIVLINSAKRTPHSIVERNRESFQKLSAWTKQHSSNKLRFHILHQENLPDKHAGAGLARKIGMDEALRRFEEAGIKNGAIVSLDADTLVSTNYLTVIEAAFADEKARVGILRFEHPLLGDEYRPEVYQAIAQYELYLRYYVHAMRLSGFPYAYHTIGSAFAVRAMDYAAVGGMNRRQGGEDFYFLHKLFPQGGVRTIRQACVIPSPRPSARVPFGTGPEVRRLANAPGKPLMTYDYDAFMEIARFIRLIDTLYSENPQCLHDYKSLHPEVRRYLDENDLPGTVAEVRANSASPDSFRKRFFNWFNAFRYLKCLNHLHENAFEQKPVIDVAAMALKDSGTVLAGNGNDLMGLLMAYRETEYGE